MISWKGKTAFERRLVNGRRRLVLESREDLERWGRTVEAIAKQNAPVDLGKLRQSIHYESIDNGNAALLTVNVPYAAFVEFGTGAGVLIPPGWEELAARFKGAGERKVNITAQPFLSPALRLETPKLLNRLHSRLLNLFT